MGSSPTFGTNFDSRTGLENTFGARFCARLTAPVTTTYANDGGRHYGTFMDAGLGEPTMADYRHIGGPSWAGFEIMAELIRSSLPLIEEFGIASAEEIGIDSLAQRLRAEAVAPGSLA